jgi:hypothetical protein
MKQPIDATVYSFPGNGFVQLPNMQNQSVSTKPVPFSNTKQALKAKSIDDLMGAGLQVFSFKENFQALGKDADAAKLGAAKTDPQLMATLASLIKSGKVVWENRERGINPNKKLGEMMGDPRPPRQKAAAKRPGMNP